MLIIDSHTHILAPGSKKDARAFMQDLCRGHFMSTGLLPSDRVPNEDDWNTVEWLFNPIDPQKSIDDHKKAGVDKIVILGIAPSDYTPYGYRGTLDLDNQTDVPGEVKIEKGNDYIAALVRKYPDSFIGFGAVNPRFRGVDAAVNEIERMIVDLELTGLKLYPMYDHYSPYDAELTFPLFEKALELEIPVIVHQASTPARFAPLEFGRPFQLDVIGREFPDLKLCVAHAGLPWVDECIVLVERHPNFCMDLSFTNSVYSREEMYWFILRCKRWGIPLTKIMWGTDYPCFETVDTLVQKFVTLNEEADQLGEPRFSDEEIEMMMSKNCQRFCGID